MENERKSPKRIIIDISEEKHAQIKMRSAFRHTSIKMWIEQAIDMKMAEEDRYN
jgi:predicted HicB family RNase H-like nuclease